MAVEEDQRGDGSMEGPRRAADHLSLSRIFHRGSQGNCFLRFIVLFRLTGAMISLLVLYSSGLYRAIMAAYLLLLLSFPLPSLPPFPSFLQPPPPLIFPSNPSGRFLLPPLPRLHRTIGFFFKKREREEGRGNLLNKARHLRKKRGVAGWDGSSINLA